MKFLLFFLFILKALSLPLLAQNTKDSVPSACSLELSLPDELRDNLFDIARLRLKLNTQSSESLIELYQNNYRNLQRAFISLGLTQSEFIELFILATHELKNKQDEQKSLLEKKEQILKTYPKEGLLTKLENRSIEIQEAILIALHHITKKQYRLQEITWFDLLLIEELSISTKLRLNSLGQPDQSPALLTPDDLAGLDNLKKIGFYDHTIKSIPETYFKSVPQLEEIYFRRVKLDQDITENLFSGLNRLKALQFDGVYIKTLPERLLQNLSSLEFFKIRSGALMFIPEKLFWNLKNIKTIIIVCPHLQFIYRNQFQGLSSLTYLIIRLPLLRELPETLLQGLTALESVSLSELKVKLPKKIFDPALKLKEINLDESSVKKVGDLPIQTFLNLPELEILSLSYTLNALQRLYLRVLFKFKGKKIKIISFF